MVAVPPVGGNSCRHVQGGPLEPGSPSGPEDVTVATALLCGLESAVPACRRQVIVMIAAALAAPSLGIAVAAFIATSRVGLRMASSAMTSGKRRGLSLRVSLDYSASRHAGGAI